MKNQLLKHNVIQYFSAILKRKLRGSSARDRDHQRKQRERGCFILGRGHRRHSFRRSTRAHCGICIFTANARARNTTTPSAFMQISSDSASLSLSLFFPLPGRARALVLFFGERRGRCRVCVNPDACGVEQKKIIESKTRLCGKRGRGVAG